MSRYFTRHLALPADHGSWAFFLGPLLIGLFAGEHWTLASSYLCVASLMAFLCRHPLTIAVKALSGRRSRQDLGPALFWIVLYGSLGLLHVAGLVMRGFGYLLYLALPGLLVLAWYLLLVNRFAERRQIWLDIAAAGALALSAPAAMWVGLGSPDSSGWLLWALTWSQSVASILHVIGRLEAGPRRERLTERSTPSMRSVALVLASLNLAAVLALGITEILSSWLFLAFAVQWLETLRFALRPPLAAKPRAIGLRQLLITCIYTIVFIFCW